jgi:hypothetical protein
MTAQRTRIYGWIMASLTLGLALLWALLSSGGIDPGGKPLGTDFTSFWAASQLSLDGHPDWVYDTERHFAAQRAIFDGADRGYAAFFYPPVFLLLCLPFATLPYLISLSLWLSVSFAFCWAVLRRYLGGQIDLLPILAFPATLQNLGHGQNAFLSTALFGGALLLLEKRPFVAGACFGALVFKPHLGILIPLFLAVTGRWRAFVSATGTAFALLSFSWLVLGHETWLRFLEIAPAARVAMEQNLVGYEKMQSLFAGLRLLGAPLALAYSAQILAAIVAAGLLVMLCRREPPRSQTGCGDQGAALVLATLLASPFLLDYDLMLLAIPLAWLFMEGRTHGFAPWEKFVLIAAFVLPLVSRSMASAIGVPLAPLVIACLFVLVLRRAGLFQGGLSRLDRIMFSRNRKAVPAKHVNPIDLK